MSLGIVILAAGRGRRMPSSCPKVLQPVGGVPLLSHVIKTAKQLSDFLCVVVGPESQAIRSTLADEPLRYVIQEQPLGTGDALRVALEDWSEHERILVLCGDVPLLQVETLEAFLKSTAYDAMGVLTALVDEPGSLGRIVRDGSGELSEIIEARDASGEQLAIQEINTGVLSFSREAVCELLPQLTAENAQGEYYLTSMVSLMKAHGYRVGSDRLAHIWEILGVNTFADLAKVERCYQQSQAARLMSQGVRFADPSRFDVRGEVHGAPDVFIDVNVVCEGVVRLAEGVRIGAHCVLEDVELGSGVEILPMSVLKGCRVGTDARVGPLARIREGTELGANTRVGNFVELKKSRVGKGSKINHLSYVGDASIGEHVNVGAGVITCNYDGVNKHETRIQDGAFIGSNTALVAPVTLGENALIGAGSVIVRNAPADQLTLSRAPQKSVNYFRAKRETIETDED